MVFGIKLKSLTGFIPTVSAIKTVGLTLKGKKKKALVSASKGVVGGLALVGATSVALAPTIVLPAVGKVALAVAKRPIKSAGVVLAGITGATVLARSPKARKIVKKAPKKFVETGITGGGIIAQTIETGKSPVSSRTALLTGGLLAGAVVGGVAIAKGVKSVKEKALVPMGQLPVGIQTPDKQIIESPVGMKQEKVVKSEVATMPKIDIDINLTNKQSNKRFINTGAVVTR